jgi:hypothetical protein
MQVSSTCIHLQVKQDITIADSTGMSRLIVSLQSLVQEIEMCKLPNEMTTSTLWFDKSVPWCKEKKRRK